MRTINLEDSMTIAPLKIIALDGVQPLAKEIDDLLVDCVYPGHNLRLLYCELNLRASWHPFQD